MREAVTLWGLSVHAHPARHRDGLSRGNALCHLPSRSRIRFRNTTQVHAFILSISLVWLAINVFSGVSLLIAYPTKALTNPLFYIKLALIAAALFGLRWMRRNVFGPYLPASAKRIAALSILAWVCAIFAGRWLAYTYTKLMTT